MTGDAALDRSFFQQDPLACAAGLIGCELTWGETAGVIVETEAYAEWGDEACHTFLKRGARAFLEAKVAGALYVYLNYGIHWMLNFLVRDGSSNGFVLVRALEPTRGSEQMASRRGDPRPRSWCSGPGKLTQALAIDGRLHGRDFFSLPEMRLSRWDQPPEVETDRRIGISKAAELPWRFLLAGSPYVSVKKTRPRLAGTGTHPPRPNRHAK